jgi:two-component system response regulator NreC
VFDACIEKEMDFSVVGEAHDTATAIDLLTRTQVDIAVVDIRLSNGESGIELTKRIKDHWPKIKILVLSAYDFDKYIEILAKLGIDGYILKDSPQETLIQALRDVISGGVVLPPSIASKVMKGFTASKRAKRNRVWDLTSRELEILELMSHGLRNFEIAERFSISVRTVEVHVRNILSKLHVKTRTEAATLAMQNNILR